MWCSCQTNSGSLHPIASRLCSNWASSSLERGGVNAANALSIRTSSYRLEVCPDRVSVVIGPDFMVGSSLSSVVLSLQSVRPVSKPEYTIFYVIDLTIPCPVKLATAAVLLRFTPPFAHARG